MCIATVPHSLLYERVSFYKNINNGLNNTGVSKQLILKEVQKVIGGVSDWNWMFFFLVWAFHIWHHGNLQYIFSQNVTFISVLFCLSILDIYMIIYYFKINMEQYLFCELLQPNYNSTYYFKINVWTKINLCINFSQL